MLLVTQKKIGEVHDGDSPIGSSLKELRSEKNVPFWPIAEVAGGYIAHDQAIQKAAFCAGKVVSKVSRAKWHHVLWQSNRQIIQLVSRACRRNLDLPVLSVAAEAASLRHQPDLVIATPGRLLDHLMNSQSVRIDSREESKRVEESRRESKRVEESRRESKRVEESFLFPFCCSLS